MRAGSTAYIDLARSARARIHQLNKFALDNCLTTYPCTPTWIGRQPPVLRRLSAVPCGQHSYAHVIHRRRSGLSYPVDTVRGMDIEGAHEQVQAALDEYPPERWTAAQALAVAAFLRRLPLERGARAFCRGGLHPRAHHG